jgi:hypothetical protein
MPAVASCTFCFHFDLHVALCDVLLERRIRTQAYAVIERGDGGAGYHESDRANKQSWSPTFLRTRPVDLFTSSIFILSGR